MKNSIVIAVMEYATKKVTVRNIASVGIHAGFVSVSFIDDGGEFQVEQIDTKRFYVCTI